MTESTVDQSTSGGRSLLAVGGVMLAALAFFGASGLLLVSLVEPTPLLMVLPFLFGPIGLAGGVMGFIGRRRHRGQTLGLMAIVLSAGTLLGVLPAGIGLGLPRFRAYQLESREQQALHFLSRLRMGAISHYHESGERRFPRGKTDWVPEAPPSARRYPFEAELWAREPWAALDFVPSAAHFHQYRYQAIDEGRGFVVEARGDLDGDGRWATYTSTVRVRDDGRFEPSRGPVRHPFDAR